MKNRTQIGSTTFLVMVSVMGSVLAGSWLAAETKEDPPSAEELLLAGSYEGEFITATGRQGTIQGDLRVTGRDIEGDPVWTMPVTWKLADAQGKHELLIHPTTVEITANESGYGFRAELQTPFFQMTGTIVITPREPLRLTGHYLGGSTVERTLGLSGTFIMKKKGVEVKPPKDPPSS